MTHQQLLAMAADENAALIAEKQSLLDENARLRATVNAMIGRQPDEAAGSTDVQFRSRAIRAG